MDHATWLTRRALLAIALIVGFYALALAVVALLLWVPFTQITEPQRILARPALLSWIAMALAILAAIVPRRDRFLPPGPSLDERSHGQLFAVIRELASVLKQEMPKAVYLVNDVNAWVTYRGGIMGFGSQRVMGLGLPLLQGLTISELKAVIAHEFGHYAAGDVKLGPRIYKTRAAIERAADTLEGSWLSVVFTWYARLFLRLTHAISRQQEFLADALSARTVHPETTASALRRSEALAIAFNGYWKQELAPALSAGCLPPITAGFERYLASEQIASAVNRFLDSAQERTETNPLDTHPPLHERVAALKQVSAAGPRPASDPPASTLLPNIETDAQELLEFHAGGMAFSQLRKVEWNDLGMVYAPQWRALTAKSSKFLDAYTTDTIPGGPDAFKKAGSQLMSGDAELRIARAQQTFGAAVAVALLDAGAVPETEPGQPFVFRKGAAAMKPFEAIAQLADGTLTVEEWQAQCRMIGIAGVPLCRAAVSSWPAGSRAPSIRSRVV